jgi:dipeptidyl aminopeptidase/acylaminoacyl peptidase
MPERRDVVFTSGDSYAAGWLFLPEQASTRARVPAVAMAHGVGAVKEMYLEPFARRFADAGVAALLFDYRSFGASGGEPRRRILPRDQIEDYRSALTWLSLQPEIDADRLGVWGTSFSGDPKRLLEVEGGHYTVYRGDVADQVGRAAAEWFTQHLA